MFVYVYGVGLLLEGVGLAVSSAILAAVANHYIGGYLRPRVRFEVSSVDLVPKEFGHLRGFQVRLRFRNNGRRIVAKPVVVPVVMREGFVAQFQRVDIHSENGKKSFKASTVVNTESFPFRWDDNPARPNLRPWEEMRKGDEAQVTFPEESRPGFFVASAGPLSGSSHGIEYKEMVELKPGKYIVNLEIKGEDPQEHTTVSKQFEKKFDLAKKETYAKYWLNVSQESETRP